MRYKSPLVAQLLEEPPVTVEVRGAMVYFHHGEYCFAQPIAAAIQTSNMVQRAVAKWQADQSCEVVELCKRKKRKKRKH